MSRVIIRRARRCKSERSRASIAMIMAHVWKLERVANLVIVDRLVDRKIWKEIAEENDLTLGESKRVFREGVKAIEKLLEMSGKLKRRRMPARTLKLR